jgi:hypothetical protein
MREYRAARFYQQLRSPKTNEHELISQDAYVAPIFLTDFN